MKAFFEHVDFAQSLPPESEGACHENLEVHVKPVFISLAGDYFQSIFRVLCMLSTASLLS